MAINMKTAMSTAGMWVLFQGEKWNISTLGEYSFRKTYLGLKASQGRCERMQDALRDLPIPVYMGIWRATSSQ